MSRDVGGREEGRMCNGGEEGDVSCVYFRQSSGSVVVSGGQEGHLGWKGL